MIIGNPAVKKKKNTIYCFHLDQIFSFLPSPYHQLDSYFLRSKIVQS